MRKLYNYFWILSATILLSACSPRSPSVTSTPNETTSIGLLQTATSTAAAQPTSTGGSPAWVRMGYAGRLILILSNPKGNQLEELDLTSGKTKILFQAPENSWLGAAVISPDGKQILLAYAPPAADGKAQFGYTDLDLMPFSGPAWPQPLLTRKDPQSSSSTQFGRQTANRYIIPTCTSLIRTAKCPPIRTTSSRPRWMGRRND